MRAGEIWDYLSAMKSRSASDAIVICCSYDLRVCDHACDLIKDGVSDVGSDVVKKTKEGAAKSGFGMIEESMNVFFGAGRKKPRKQGDDES